MAQPLDYAPVARRRAVLVPARAGVLIAVVLTAFLASVMLVIRHADRRCEIPSVLRCSNNLSQIYRGMVLYADDFGGAAAPDFATLLANEDLVPETFVCTHTADTRSTATTSDQRIADLMPGSGHCSYVYVKPRGPFDKVPSEAVLAYEPPGNHPDLKWANVLLGDGRVERVDVQQLNALIAAQRLGTWPLRVTTQLGQ